MSALLDALGWVGESLDKPGRSVRGLLAGRPEELMNLIPFSDTFGLTDPSRSVSGRGLLEQYGMLAPKEEGEGFGWGDIAGMGVEAALDPTNLIGGGALKRLLGARRAAEASNASREALLARGAIPEELARTTKAVGASGEIAPFYHGTGRDFGKFDISKLHDKSGAFFAADRTMAERYRDVLHGDRGAFDMDSPKFRDLVARQLQESGVTEFTPDDIIRMAKDSGPYGPQGEMFSWSDFGISDPVEYALPHMTKPRVISAYLSAQNPFNALNPLEISEARKLHSAIDAASSHDIPFGKIEKLYSSGGPVSGQDVWDVLRMSDSDAARRGMQSLGYDAVLHNDSKYTWDIPNADVMAVFDPSQIYSTLVAPPMVRLPRISPLLAALGLENVLARGSNQI